jgi:hypothetical protein
VGGAIFLNRFAMKPKKKILLTWLVAIVVIALVALIAGFLTFGGADMGR